MERNTPTCWVWIFCDASELLQASYNLSESGERVIDILGMAEQQDVKDLDPWWRSQMAKLTLEPLHLWTWY